MRLGLPRAVIRIGHQLRNIWRLAAPYFRSEKESVFDLGRLGTRRIKEKWIACSLLFAILLIELSQVGVTVLTNQWYARFFNAIQEKNITAFWRELAIYSAIAAVFVCISAYQVYVNRWLHIRWRTWLTDRHVERWLDEGLHYRMRLSGDAVDNPDQRIADDIEMFVSRTLLLAIGFLSAMMTLVSFIVILWGLSAQVPFAIAGAGVPGSLVWIAIIFSLFGTLIIHCFGWPLVALNFSKQRVEADFRSALVRLRENSEQVALARGERAERDVLTGRFGNVRCNWYDTMSREKKLTFLTSGYNQLAVILPMVIVAPYYFAGALPLGTLMQTGSAFGQVQTALSFFVHAYSRLAEWNTAVNRLLGFEAEAERAAGLIDKGVRRVSNDKAEMALAVECVDVRLPDGTPLVIAADFKVRRGEALLLTGPSGAGKSTLFRALGSIWPFACGEVSVAPGTRLLILSQRPYLPLGSLGFALAYPTGDRGVSPDDTRDIMYKVGLGRLADRCDDVINWTDVLSLGEQQRLAFARALLVRPDVLLLDEATSALDESSEAVLYRMLRRELPQAAIVSIGHRSTLASLHDRSINCAWMTAAGSNVRTFTPRRRQSR
jgi:vitamin B12/bleomycin/antimicrobial peptide transport system ATP-binding/permease protein